MNNEQPRMVNTGSVVSRSGNTSPNITYNRNSNLNNACMCQVIRLIQDIDGELNMSDRNDKYNLKRSVPNMVSDPYINTDVENIKEWWIEYREFLFEKFHIRRFDMVGNLHGEAELSWKKK